MKGPIIEGTSILYSLNNIKIEKYYCKPFLVYLDFL